VRYGDFATTEKSGGRSFWPRSLSGKPTIRPSDLHQCLEAEKAILPTDGGPTDQGRLVQRSTDNPCFQGTRAQRLSIFKAGSLELDGNRGGAMTVEFNPMDGGRGD
jgi:hypothetical protein